MPLSLPRKRTVLLRAIILLQSSHSLTVEATNYQFSKLDFPQATQGTIAYDINNLGQIVGVFYDEQGAHGFLYTADRYNSLNAPNATLGSFAYAINDKAQIVGNFINNTGKHGFFYADQQYSILDNPNGGDTNLTGINNNGMIVGNYRLGTTGIYGFVYDSQYDLFTTINNPKASAGNTSAMGINDLNTITGFYYNTGAHGFSYNNGQFSTLDVPQASLAGSFSYGINNLDQKAGVSYNRKEQNSFVYTNGAYEILTAENVKTIYAYGINDLGQVVGYFTDSQGSHGFIATPETTHNQATQLNFKTLKSSYKAGENLTINLEESSELRQQALDLWVAVLTPQQELLFISPENKTLLSASATPFKRNVSINETHHLIIDTKVPSNVTGRFTVYALFTNQHGVISELSQIIRSNIANTTFEFR